MSSLLINEPPLQVLPSLAAAIGLNEAIALQQLHYWLAHAKKSHDGKMWIYKTYAEWKAQDFPFWSERTIQRTFLNLEKLMIVLSAKLADNKHNKVNFYTIDYEVLAKLEIKTRSIPCKFDSAKLASSNMTDCHHPLGQNGTIQDDKMARSLRDKKESNEENKKDTLGVSFDDFWNLYDKKRGDKDKIEKKWQSLKDSEREAIMNHLPLYKKSQPNKKYRKDPSTYLNNKSWNDEIIFDDGQQPVSHDYTEQVAAPVFDEMVLKTDPKVLAMIAAKRKGGSHGTA